VLSACAEIEMIPPLIVRRALELGLSVIAITDHNCAANVAATIEAAAHTGLTVLPGMEVQTREEVHMLCLFDTLEQVNTWDQTVAESLPDEKNNEPFFGAQYVVDASGAHRCTEERLLATSTSLTVEQVVAGVNALRGICLPAHVDRPSFSILSNLGFVPPGLPIAGIEISARLFDRTKFAQDTQYETKTTQNISLDSRFSSSPESGSDKHTPLSPQKPVLTTPQKLVELFADLDQYGMIVNSDAHRLAEMGARTQVTIAAPTVSELSLALSGQRTRHIELVSHL
jgi:hypothetical protein